MKKGDLVFVYGTLMSGQSNGLDENSGARFIAKDEVRGKLYDLGWYPGFKDDPSGGTVKGEVFEILDETTATGLDAYEGYPHLYDRKETTTLDNRLVWVYIWQGDVLASELVPSGNWQEWQVCQRAAV